MTNDEILAAVRSSVSQSLGIEEDEVRPDATLMVDLGAEWIDFLDIMFRIDRKTGIRVKVSAIRGHIMGALSVDQFRDPDGFVTLQAYCRYSASCPMSQRRRSRAGLRRDTSQSS